MSRDLAALVPRLARARVLLVGDLVLDEYVFGVTERISREAPVPIVRETHRSHVLGGAANVAANLRAIGARVEVVGRIGKDAAGDRLLAMLREAGAGVAGVVRDPAHPTERKTRILAGGLSTTPQQVLRLDSGSEEGASDKALAARLAAQVEKRGPKAQVVLVSDYGLGVLGPVVKKALTRLAKGVPVIVDSRFDLRGYRGVTGLKPNRPELEGATGRRITDARSASAAARALARQLSADWVLVTRGHDGLTYQPETGPAMHLPVHGPPEAVDVTGAGDTVLAILGAALAAGLETEAAVSLANIAGGLVVQKPGTATVHPDELTEAIA